MKKRILFLLLFLMLLASCSKGNVQNNKISGTYEIATQLVYELWEVDYTTFTEERMREFAAQYFEPSYREDFLSNPEENVDIEHVQQTKLISHVLEVQNKGGEVVELDGQTFYAQDLQMRVHIQQFLPKDPGAYIYQEGETYTLDYRIFFIEETDASYIAGFTYGLPEAEKAPLTAQQRQEMLNLAKAYIDLRYNLAYETALVEDIWKFYEENVDYAFLLQDGITKASITEMISEYKAYHVHITCNDSVFTAQDKPVTVELQGEIFSYYAVEVEFTYQIEADDSFYIDKMLEPIKTLKEIIYFDIGPMEEVYIVFARYVS